MRVLGLVRAASILALCPISLGHAQSLADFYKGKTIDLYIGYSAGGGYPVAGMTSMRVRSPAI